jgi:hypothetical protein
VKKGLTCVQVKEIDNDKKLAFTLSLSLTPAELSLQNYHKTITTKNRGQSPELSLRQYV